MAAQLRAHARQPATEVSLTLPELAHHQERERAFLRARTQHGIAQPILERFLRHDRLHRPVGIDQV